MIQLEHIYKIWGPNPESGIDLLRQGRTKQELHDQHQLVVGLNDINLEVHKGELFVIMGLSGSGKSTLLRTVNRLIEPTAGRILIDGEDITAMKKAQLRKVRGQRMAMVFQHFALLPHRTVLENVVFGLELQGVAQQEREEAGREALELVGLGGWDDYLPDELSGGMQQRVGLARALATHADILLMDEAFSALDPLIRQELRGELVQLQERLHKTIIFITHDLDEALSIGDRVAILRAGEVVQMGTPEEIVLDPADDHVATFVQNVNLMNVLTAAQISRPLPLREKVDVPRTEGYRWANAGQGEVLLLDQHQRPLGIVAENTARATGWDPQQLPLRDVTTINEETVLRDLLRAGPDAIPAVVLDADGRACGIIRARSVIDAFTEWDEQTSAIIQTGEEERSEPTEVEGTQSVTEEGEERQINA